MVAWAHGNLGQISPLTKRFADLSRTMANGSVSRKKAAANDPESMAMQRVVVMALMACFKGIYDR